MTKNITLIAATITSIVKEIDDKTLYGRWEIGKIIEEFLKNRNDKVKLLVQLAKATKLNVSTLNKYRQIFNTFSISEIKRLRHNNMKYSHVTELMRLSPGQRPLFIKETIKHSWNCIELQEKVDEHLCVNRIDVKKVGPGRTHYIPVSSIVGLQRLNKMLSSLVNYGEILEESILTKNLDMADPTIKTLAGRVRDNLDFLSDKFAGWEKKLAASRGRKVS